MVVEGKQWRAWITALQGYFLGFLRKLVKNNHTMMEFAPGR